MCTPAAIPYIVMAVTATAQVHATRQQAKAVKQVADRNAKAAEIQAVDAEMRGKEEEARHRLEVGNMLGTQSALIGASGADTGSGSAITLLSDTAALGELDALIIRNNTAREVWGLKTQAGNFRYQGLSALSAARGKNFGTLLGAAGQAMAFGAKTNPNTKLGGAYGYGEQ